MGLKTAIEMSADFAAIIDNDVVADPILVGCLLQPFSGTAKVGLTAPIVTYYDDPDRVWFARGSYNRTFGYTKHLHLGKRLRDIASLIGTTFGTDYAPTCAVMLSREAIEQVGLPDERFFFGHDDVDWCLRAREKGFLRLVVGQPLARHKISTTGGKRGSTVFTEFSAYHHAAGSVLMTAKHAPGTRLPPYLAGQLMIRFPYYSLTMLQAGRIWGPLSYARGLAAGARYLLPSQR